MKKNALVIGGTKGIGKAITLALARDGFSVFVCGRSKQDIVHLQQIGLQKNMIIDGDVCDAEKDVDLENIVDRAINRFGSIDTMVFAVGRAFSGNTIGLSTADWDDCFRINLRAPFVAAKSVLPRMIKNGGGSLVFISTIWAFTTPRDRVAYIAAKTGLTALVRGIAIDHGDQGVRANAVAPGYVDTEYLNASIASVHGSEKVNRVLQDVYKAHPSKKMVQPKEVGEAVAFLSSDKSSGFNGQTLVIDGGASMKFSLADAWRRGEY